MPVTLQGKKGRYRFDPYVQSSKLGAGGMGIVYLGEEVLTGKKVAIKVIYNELASNPILIKRAAQESNIHIDHDNVIEMIEMVENKGIYHIISEYLEGDSLDQKILKEGKIAPALALGITGEILKGLEALHQRNPPIIHRDIKPSNIFICGDGAVKIMDFGVARTLEDSNLNLTRAGTVVGTPHYSAPEQIRSQTDLIDHTTDIYSVGVTLYEMITGKVPFEGNSEYDTLKMQVEDPVPHNAFIPPAIFNIISKATAKEQKQRFRSATDFRKTVSLIRLKTRQTQKKKKKKSSTINIIFWIALALILLTFIDFMCNPYAYSNVDTTSDYSSQLALSPTISLSSAPFEIGEVVFRTVDQDFIVSEFSKFLYAGYYRIEPKIYISRDIRPDHNLEYRIYKRSRLVTSWSQTVHWQNQERVTLGYILSGEWIRYEAGKYRIDFLYEGNTFYSQEFSII